MIRKVGDILQVSSSLDIIVHASMKTSSKFHILPTKSLNPILYGLQKLHILYGGGVNLPDKIEMFLGAPEGGAVISNWVFMMY